MNQTKNDQIIALMEHAVENLREHAEITLQDCEQILAYGRQNHNDMYLGFAHYYSGEAYYTLNNVEKVLYHISQAIGYLERANAWELVARAYNLTGITSIAIGNAAFAMNYYVQALACSRRAGLLPLENTVCINIGMLYYSYGEYEKARNYFLDSLNYLKEHPETENYYQCVAVDYIGLGRCALHTGDTGSAQQCEQKICEVCNTHMDMNDYSFLTFRAALYHAIGDLPRTDQCIGKIHQNLGQQIQIMDYFEDLYEYALLLLELDKDQLFLELIQRLDQLAIEARVVNLQHRIRQLKIRYYKKTGNREAYLNETALFYEDTVRMDQSNQAMVRGMMDICCVLEQERQERSQIEAQNQQLAEKSETDALTGLPNRFRLNRDSIRQFAQATTDHIPVAVEILDIDYFKQYNDNYGHQKGDRCICTIAEELRRISAYDGVSAYRYGGDEFVVLYTGLDQHRVQEIAEELRRRICALRVEHIYSKVSDIVSISQGICWGYPTKKQRMADYLHTADDALYEVKKSERGKICFTGFSDVD